MTTRARWASAHSATTVPHTACARYFGDLDDPSSDIAKKVADVGGEALFADLGLNPSVLYVGLSQVEGLPATSAIHRGGNVVKPYEG